MNADLLETLEEAGLEASFVGRIRASDGAYRVAPGFRDRVMALLGLEHTCCVRFGRHAVLGAATAAAVLAVVFCTFFASSGSETVRLVRHQGKDGCFSASSAAPWVQAFAVRALARRPVPVRALDDAVAALVRTQDADGSWRNDALSALNTAALKSAVAAGLPAARSAYRRGARYLRLKGIPEMRPEEFSRQARHASERLGCSADDGLRMPLAICASL